jgi:hypothetical protein
MMVLAGLPPFHLFAQEAPRCNGKLDGRGSSLRKDKLKGRIAQSLQSNNRPLLA